MSRRPWGEDSAAAAFIPAGIPARRAQSLASNDTAVSLLAGGRSRMSHLHAIAARTGAGLLLGAVALAATPAHRVPGDPAAVSAKLSEWKVELSERTIAAGTLKQFGDEREGLESQVKNGPYSNNVTTIAGTFTFTAWDKGAVRDSVDGVAEFTSQDGARWKLVLDRVQTKDVPHHPRFGGVILGLYYHGATQVHTPLVPTINSAVALWAVGHLYKNDQLVTDNAMVHVMLLSRTRRDGDFALACWDCSKNKIEELQLQILPGPGEPKFDAPGGFLFVNWEKSRSR